MSGISEKSNLQKITSHDLENHIESGKKLENLEISGDIVIINSITDTLDFFNCKFSNLSIHIELERLIIHDCDFVEINIEANVNKLYLRRINSENSIINASKISIDFVNINDCKQIDQITFDEIEVIKLYCFKSKIKTFSLIGTFEKVFFNKGNQIETLLVVGEFKDVQIVHSLLPKEQISPNNFEDIHYQNKLEKGNLKIQNSSITNLYSIGQHIDTYIELTEVSCTKATFIDDFGANGTVKIKKCNELSTISFTSANMANFEIFNSNFSNTSFISSQSIIENIKWQSVEWSENLERYRNSENGHELNDSFCRETLRVLKLNAQNQQDSINYIKFHSLEQQAYKKQIKTKKWYNEDRLLLWLNKISNNHGLSWKRGVWFSLGIGAIFFIPNLFLLNNPYWKFGWNNWSDFWGVIDTTLKLFSQSLFAAHSFDYLKEYNPKGIVFLIDLIGRIFLTYGYYQTIVAFRKYGRK